MNWEHHFLAITQWAVCLCDQGSTSGCGWAGWREDLSKVHSETQCLCQSLRIWERNWHVWANRGYHWGCFHRVQIAQGHLEQDLWGHMRSRWTDTVSSSGYDLGSLTQVSPLDREQLYRILFESLELCFWGLDLIWRDFCLWFRHMPRVLMSLPCSLRLDVMASLCWVIESEFYKCFQSNGSAPNIFSSPQSHPWNTCFCFFMVHSAFSVLCFCTWFSFHSA